MKRKDVSKLILSPRHRGSFSCGVAIPGIITRGAAACIKCVSVALIPDSVGRLGEVTLNGFEQVAASWERNKLGNQIIELDQLENS